MLISMTRQRVPRVPESIMKLTIPLMCSILLTGTLFSEPFLELGPMLGHVGPTEANIWIKASGEAEPAVIVGDRDDLAGAASHPAARLDASRDFMTSLKVGGLEPAKRYFYAISLDGKMITQRPYPSFNTAPPVGEPGRQRIAFTSCLGQTGSASAAAWAQMEAAANADLIILLGDDHYADTTAREAQLSAYVSHRSVPAYRALAARVPSYNIWDDHDYGPNDSDGSAQGKEISLATFKDFWPNPSYGEPDNPGIYFRFSRGQIDFFMLDVRYHRSPDKMIDDGSKTMLGARQLAWLKRELEASTAKVKIIASGSEWQRFSHADSWSSYPREREDLFDFIREQAITGILLISGDRHFTGGYQIGGELIEITSGPLGSKNFPTKNLPEMFFNQGEGKLYSVFDIDTRGPTPEIKLEVHRAGDGIVHQISLPWAAVLGKQKLETLPVEITPKKAPFQIPAGS